MHVGVATVLGCFFVVSQDRSERNGDVVKCQQDLRKRKIMFVSLFLERHIIYLHVYQGGRVFFLWSLDCVFVMLSLNMTK